MFRRSLMCRGGEAGIAASALSAVGDDKPISRLSEIVEQFAGDSIIDDGSDRGRNVNRRALAAGAVAAFAMTAAFGLVFGVEAEMKQRVVMLAGHQRHVAAASAVATARSAAGNEFLAPERKTPVAAVAGFHVDSYFVYEQLLFSGRRYVRLNADELAQAAAVAEVNHAGDLCKQRVVFPEADIFAWLDTGAALPDDDRAARNQLPAKSLHAQAL